MIEHEHAPPIKPSGSFLMISAHDYRSKRRANVHFIMRELSNRGHARFASVGYSPLSLLAGDPRSSLWKQANYVDRLDGVECYLWRTFLHPFNFRRLRLSALEKPAFKMYARCLPAILRQWIAEADTIILESGIAIIFFDVIKLLNPQANVIYLCSDALDTIGCARFLLRELRRVSIAFNGIRIPSQKLVPEFPLGCSVYFVPHGMDPVDMKVPVASPYIGGTNLVSIGSMLFDKSFFHIAAPAFPDYTFHIIGGGNKAQGFTAPNIRTYGEMPFRETLGYIQHAQIGIAPYDGGKVSAYLVDTSMKLMQFEAYGLPAVCPFVAAGNRYGRFGYDPGSEPSIIAAIRGALDFGRFQGRQLLSWKGVVDRILSPNHYPDTAIEHNSQII